MLDFLRKAIRAKREEAKPQAAHNELAITRLRRGGFLDIDPLPFRMHAEHLAFEPPQGGQKIEAYGKVALGAGAELHRYYLTDDAWLQVSTTAGAIDEFKLWTFADTKHPATFEAFERWAQEGSEMGRRQIEFAGKRYERVWGEQADWAPPVQFVEEVYNDSDTIPAYRTTHHAMLFQREVAATDRMEYLLISAELTGEEFCVVHSLGVDVTLADLQIT